MNRGIPDGSETAKTRAFPSVQAVAIWSLQRRAYGFSSELEERQDRAPMENRNNFKNYRLRVIAHCG